MFAVLLSEKLTPFFQNISAFPTVIFTVILGVAVLYWLVAVLGLVDIDIIDLDVEPDASSGSAGDVLAGLLLRFGLQGVPVTIIVTFVALFGWLLSYYLSYLFFSIFPGIFFRYLLGIPVFLVSLFVAVMITAQIIKPIRTLFQKAQQHTEKSLIGQTVIVRTSRVDASFGEAVMEDGGAGLILKVRSAGDRKYEKGEKVVLLEYDVEDNNYRVVSEQEFKNM